jgi:hypothetical protein
LVKQPKNHLVLKPHLEKKDNDMEQKLKELEMIGQQILSGEYDDEEQIISKYKALRKELEDAGIVVLDGIDIDNLVG